MRVLAWAATRGFSPSVDAIGNVFMRRPGSDPTASPVVAGSHLDTQPTGGNFDGVYGVLALSVASRRREIAIRTAIGAHRRDIRNLVLGEGFRLVAMSSQR